MHKIIIIGGGGHFRSCLEIIEENKFLINGVIDKEKKKILNYKIYSEDNYLEKLRKNNHYAFITIGQIKSYSKRKKIFEKLLKLKYKIPVIKSKNSIISKNSKIGAGTIIMRQSQIGYNSKIGKNCILNDKSLIEHDCTLGDNVHISTGAILNGNVSIGSGSFIGSGSIIKNNVKIGRDVVVGAGQYVSKDVQNNSIIK